jgi:hypothetical protein
MRKSRIPVKPWSVALAVATATALGCGGVAHAATNSAADELAPAAALPAHFAAPYLQIE